MPRRIIVEDVRNADISRTTVDGGEPTERIRCADGPVRGRRGHRCTVTTHYDDRRAARMTSRRAPFRAPVSRRLWVADLTHVETPLPGRCTRPSSLTCSAASRRVLLRNRRPTSSSCMGLDIATTRVTGR